MKYREQLLSTQVVTVVPYGAAVVNKNLISCKNPKTYCKNCNKQPIL